MPSPAAGGPVAWADAAREAAFGAWLAATAPAFQLRVPSLRSASADASFRRYFRIDAAQGSCIVMDAPPAKENSEPFVRIARLMADAGLRVPEVLAWDEANGFMLLSDLGAKTMMEVIDPEVPQASHAMYMAAVDTLIRLQVASRPGVLPPYDEALLRRELALFPDWYLVQHKGVVLDAAQTATLNTAFDKIVAHNLAAPSVYVHRDYMPRNLMLADQGLGVLDFQDAVYGPITYDIASLMRDAFLSWEENFVLDITIRYWERARKAGLPVGDDFGEFYRGVEWMGLQRHLKVAGIFARLTLRDGKPRYLADTPRFIAYIRATTGRYNELRPLMRLIDDIEGTTPVTGFAYGRM
ncbi:aminoglycoside phosphotransferase [Rhodoferax koreense]|uniref:Aminoglycoside phosphotransferase n=1 Tax=Rhodoferax koreensis TaxID=1842727 RepID=A0A1P8K2T2_9BURK|nr:aminoglycoside phosphotransferase [Rhodoferax koreense]